MRSTGNEIGDKEAAMISEALKSNSRVTTLNLSCNRKKNKEIKGRDKIKWDVQGMRLEQKEQEW